MTTAAVGACAGAGTTAGSAGAVALAAASAEATGSGSGEPRSGLSRPSLSVPLLLLLALAAATGGGPSSRSSSELEPERRMEGGGAGAASRACWPATEGEQSRMGSYGLDIDLRRKSSAPEWGSDEVRYEAVAQARASEASGAVRVKRAIGLGNGRLARITG